MNKKLILGFLSASLVAGFWACGTGDIETLSGSDENALGLYGFGENAMDGLVSKAKQDCKDDPDCVAAQEGASLIDDDDDDDLGDVDEESSDSSEDSSGSTDGSSASAGTSSATATSSGAVGSSSGTATSSAAMGSSSSTGLSSSSVRSSSSVAASSSSAGPGPAKGICKADPISIVKGNTVNWKAVKMGGTFVTYDWTFAEGGSITSSKDSVPSVKYDKPGTYSASLFINKGTDTTSAEITCKVIVTGVPVKGCTCSSPDASNTLYYKSGTPATSSWKVSGCTGGETFNYTWGGTGISGSSTSASGSFTSAGSVAPTLTVTNEDGEKMSVTCPAVKVEAFPLSGSCSLYSASSSYMPRSTVKFSVPSRTWNQNLGQKLTMDVEGAYEAATATVDLYYNADGAFSFKAPDTPGQQTVKLTYKGMEFCSMTLTVSKPNITGKCSVSPSRVITNEPSSFVISSNSSNDWNTTLYGASLPMTFMKGDGSSKDTTISKSGGTVGIGPFAKAGSYTYTLKYKDDTYCYATLTVEKPKFTGTCSFSSATMVPGETVKFNAGPFTSDWKTTILGDELGMTLTGSDGSSKNLTVTHTSAGYDVTPPETPGTYKYTLKYAGDEICNASVKVNPLAASCSDLTAYTKQVLSSGLDLSLPATSSVPLDIVINGAPVGGNATCQGGNCAYTITAPETPGTYDYEVYLNGDKKCSAKMTVNKPVTCSVSNATINEGQSITFTTAYGDNKCSSATTTINDVSTSTGCKTSQTFTPDRSGTYTYKYAATGTYGADECSATVTVNAVAPTCSVADTTLVQTGTDVNITPIKLTGCLNDANGCHYSIQLGGEERKGGSSYSGGTIGLTGEENSGVATYTLVVSNAQGDGECQFNVGYYKLQEITLTYGGSLEKMEQGIYHVYSTNQYSGVLRCQSSSGSVVIQVNGKPVTITTTLNSVSGANPRTNSYVSVIIPEGKSISCKTEW